MKPKKVKPFRDSNQFNQGAINGIPLSMLNLDDDPEIPEATAWVEPSYIAPAHTPGDEIYYAIDPGKASGVCIYRPGQDHLLTFSTIDFDQVMHMLEQVRTQDVVIIETFEIRPTTHKKTRQSEAMNLVGAARFAAYQEGATFVEQTAGSAKGFTEDKWIEDHIHPSRVPFDSRHSKDAFRHLVYFLANGDPNWPAFVTILMEEQE